MRSTPGSEPTMAKPYTVAACDAIPVCGFFRRPRVRERAVGSPARSRLYQNGSAAFQSPVNAGLKRRRDTSSTRARKVRATRAENSSEIELHRKLQLAWIAECRRNPAERRRIRHALPRPSVVHPVEGVERFGAQFDATAIEGKRPEE